MSSGASSTSPSNKLGGDLDLMDLDTAFLCSATIVLMEELGKSAPSQVVDLRD
jgi:hypothetical protein